jgi:DNA-binding NarL/FixJ family response regulator
LPPARRVIVVDDHPSFRRSAKALLTAEGFEVVGEAVDGASALAAAAELAPELVLLDIQLPDIDGFEVARRLLESQPELRIVLVSSRDSSQYGPLIEASGARGFVSKGDLSGESLERLLD